MSELERLEEANDAAIWHIEEAQSHLASAQDAVDFLWDHNADNRMSMALDNVRAELRRIKEGL